MILHTGVCDSTTSELVSFDHEGCSRMELEDGSQDSFLRGRSIPEEPREPG